ncbi:MAG TPA: hypothetical protein VK045_07425 [Ornithinicoccus sp.]|nr:hypothetical protein [Ornithinicoccus sp.]
MRRSMTIALTATALLGLSACGDGTEPLTQEQTREALLTDADFPLDGFTAGDVTEGSADEGGEGDPLSDFPGQDQLSDECVEILEGLNELETGFGAQSSVDFTGEEDAASPLGAPTVSVLVASSEEGDNPLDAIDELNSACEEVTIEEEGAEMTLGFEEIEADAQGTRISMGVMGMTFDITMVGRENAGNYAIVMGTGVSEEQIVEVLEAQEEKMADL